MYSHSSAFEGFIQHFFIAYVSDIILFEYCAMSCNTTTRQYYAIQAEEACFASAPELYFPPAAMHTCPINQAVRGQTL